MCMFIPTYLVPRITDLDPQGLYDRGYRALLLDVDNTLTTHHNPAIPQDVRAWLDRAAAAGLTLVIVSNSKQFRTKPKAEMLGLPYVSLACKPLPFGFLKAIKTTGLQKRDCLAIGDQTFTDVLGARIAGIAVVQTEPIQPESGWSFRLRRRCEVGIRRRAKAILEKKERML